MFKALVKRTIQGYRGYSSAIITINYAEDICGFETRSLTPGKTRFGISDVRLIHSIIEIVLHVVAQLNLSFWNGEDVH
ncbi:hypothetical protein OS493_001772 [Desmophyllum pertusum]|uniref:Uncharacterized protein n=1 Tax=Desmophyllum pertusum TaxID=174260 RepID=A0A9X0CTJ9_9CNID|nr:hypothetical protein OS493_001772 [Desmophyllum pertusum]